MNELFDLSSEVAVVLGGTGVLGGALAGGLAGAGAQVAILGRNAERGTTRVEAIRKAGGGWPNSSGPRSIAKAWRATPGRGAGVDLA
jgi:NAD(P)-dependent dehydrogenase (short-subunit alcohol dehydrogenase family)